MKVFIGSDHGGYEMKAAVLAHLTREGAEVFDCGCYSPESCDYPDIAREVCGKLLADEGIGKDVFGVLICGTGVGMSIMANRNKGIRAASCGETYSARMSREHNDANLLCLGARVVGRELALDIVDVFLSAQFEGDRHIGRIAKFDA